jgi:hypothetical protein
MGRRDAVARTSRRANRRSYGTPASSAGPSVVPASHRSPDIGRASGRRGGVSQTVEEKAGDLVGFVEPACGGAHVADAAQRSQQGGAGDVAAEFPGLGSLVEELREGLCHPNAGVTEDG